MLLRIYLFVTWQRTPCLLCPALGWKRDTGFIRALVFPFNGQRIQANKALFCAGYLFHYGDQRIQVGIFCTFKHGQLQIQHFTRFVEARYIGIIRKENDALQCVGTRTMAERTQYTSSINNYALSVFSWYSFLIQLAMELRIY
jgi:hypothetical protein